MTKILREVGMIARCLDSISNYEFKELQLSKGQYLYLVRICENPGIIQEKVADILKIDRTTAARAIQKLELEGFIQKVDHPVNKKVKRLFPTEKGKDIYLVLKNEEEYSTKVALNGLTPEEVETAYQLLYKIRKNIEMDWKFVKKGGKREY
ncbi:MarR family winged helix-turn-helix transcriptional regulator [Thermoflavimicrobium daqui]|uniref:MarR family transcriptional regulator n=1 Tax=Thermoflavimicrobium daqui TaxID=2137476 RepID=A0A364K141_9BACL|nr:MarR family transcriptional regulator [Thermoflavimicrobium daqui]RAL21401.1 MarR family transcriptional regulator [Thermoflavimicrobium daqui]